MDIVINSSPKMAGGRQNKTWSSVVEADLVLLCSWTNSFDAPLGELLSHEVKLIRTLKVKYPHLEDQAEK